MKKKLLLIVLTFLLMFSLMPSRNVKAEESGSHTPLPQTYSNDIVISPSITSHYSITTGETYTVEGGTYSYGIRINTTEQVTLNIVGDIEYTSTSSGFIVPQLDGCNVTINAFGHTIDSEDQTIIYVENKVADLHINGGTFKISENTESRLFSFKNGGTINCINIATKGQINATNTKVNISNSSMSKKKPGVPPVYFEGCDVTLDNLTSEGQIKLYDCNTTINGGTYTYNATVFYINGGNSYLNDVSATSAVGNIIINSAGSTPGKVTITGGTFEGNPTVVSFSNKLGGTMMIKGATINNGCIKNVDSYLNIEEGTVINCVTNSPGNVPYGIKGGTIRMNGGIINGNNSLMPIVDNDPSDDIEINSGTISGGIYGVYVEKGGTVKIGGSAIVEGNDADVYLATNNTFIVKEGYERQLSVAVEDTVPENTKRQITVADSNASDLDYQKKLKVVSADPSYSVNYDETGKYLYLWKHTHTWDYTVNGNKVIAKCTAHSSCMYYDEGLELVLNAENMVYSGEQYNLANIINDITDITGASASAIKYVGREGTSYDSAIAPTNAGKYTASVIIGGTTATKDFEITRVKVNKPQGDDTKFTYNGQNQTYQIVDNALYTVTGNVQKEVGNYTVTVSLKDTVNYEWNDGSTDALTFAFNIEAKKETKPDETETEETKPESKPEDIKVEEINPSETKPTTEKTEGIVNTGDSAHMMFYSMMMLLSVLGISLSIMRRNRG